jgi:hypothetical protein
LRKLPGNCMFPSAGSKNKNIHVSGDLSTSKVTFQTEI